MTERDLPSLRLVLADELVYIHSSSTRQSKSEHLGDLERGVANYRRIDVKEQVPYVYGNTGLIQGVATFTTGPAGSESAPSTLRYTSVYVKRHGRWQMVAFSCSGFPRRDRSTRWRATGGSPPRLEATDALLRWLVDKETGIGNRRRSPVCSSQLYSLNKVRSGVQLNMRTIDHGLV
jgi:hypothetical protein